MKLIKKTNTLLSFLAIAGLTLTACGGGSDGLGSSSGSGGGNSGSGTDDDPTSWAVGPDGAAVSLIKIDDPVTISAKGLTENTRYSVTITDPTEVEHNPAGGYVVTSDEEGRLTNLTVIQNLSLTQSNAANPVPRSQITTKANGTAPGGGGDQGETPFIDPTEPPPAVAGSAYTIEIKDSSGTTQRTIQFGVSSNERVYCSNSAAAAKESFTPAENVFVRVVGTAAADGSYKVHAISDLNAVLTEGAFLSGAAQADMQITAGDGLVDMGAFSSGPYDVVVDLNANGVFDRNTDLISRHRRQHSCFTVQVANSGQTAVGQIAADRGGNYRDVFDPSTSEPFIRDVWAYITPAEQSQIKQSLGVNNYIVQHKNSWANGDALTDVSSVVEVDPVQRSSINQAPWPVWSRQQLAPGCYDAVVDVNHNGAFDSGIDFVDNIDNQGVASCGFRVADPACASNITLTSPSNGENVDATAISLAGTAANNPVSGSVNIVAGSQANAVNLSFDAAGAFSATIPLFNGRNVLTVSFIYPDGSACARTVSVISSSAASANSLFRVQMTWDGDTDMDLHLTRPNGVYNSSDDDCYYINCKVGLNGSGSNGIEWGQPGEDDDAKLDVDCISCGNGIENIWMNEINEDGIYTIYLDAFSGQETNVTATVFVRNAQVGQINCGDLNTGTIIDTCRVGTISWEGGSGGTGTFVLDGTKGPESDFQ